MSERLRTYPSSADSSQDWSNGASRLSARPQARLPFGPTTSGSISIETVLARIHALPTFSPVVVRALQLADRETISAREIVGTINGDSRFSSRVVRAANSAAYSTGRAVTSVSDAVMLLGTESIREVVLIAAAREIFYRPLSGYGLSARDLWSHSLSCAMAAEIIAKLTGYSNPIEAFIAGLLHDVGKIVLNDEMTGAAPFVRELIQRTGCPFIEAERAVLGYDHCDIGGRIARSWGVQQHIVQAITQQRKPVIMRQTVPLAGYVHLGEVITSTCGIGMGFEGLDFTLETQTLTDFKLTEETVDLAISRLADKLRASENLFTPPAPSPETRAA